MMEQHSETYFLGANSPDGFYSLYDRFTDPRRDALYILKGGPGCGKSTFMRIIAGNAAAAGFPTECMLCSGDPRSVDAIYIRGLHTAFVDGTAPHVTEPAFPGVTASYVDLGAFYDSASLAAEREAIFRLNAAYKKKYDGAYRYIRAAAQIGEGVRMELLTPELRETVRRKAKSICRKTLVPGNADGTVRYRFLSALTCSGKIFLYETAEKLAETVYAVDNTCGLAPLLISDIAGEALRLGQSAVVCPSPMDPEHTEHLILPELSLAFVSIDPDHPLNREPSHHVALDALARQTCGKEEKLRFRHLEKLEENVVAEAIEELRHANALHDELERHYNPHVDFDGVYALADVYSHRLLP